MTFISVRKLFELVSRLTRLETPSNYNGNTCIDLAHIILIGKPITCGALWYAICAWSKVIEPIGGIRLASRANAARWTSFDTWGAKTIRAASLAGVMTCFDINLNIPQPDPFPALVQRGAKFQVNVVVGIVSSCDIIRFEMKFICSWSIANGLIIR